MKEAYITSVQGHLLKKARATRGLIGDGALIL